MMNSLTSLATITRRMSKLSVASRVISSQSLRRSGRNSDFLKQFGLSQLKSGQTVAPYGTNSLIYPLSRRTFSSKEGSPGSLKDEDWQLKMSLDDIVDGEKKSATQGLSSNASKRRGGKVARKREEKLMNQEKKIQESVTQFPSLRFSDEETERLLAEAYAGIPKKTGKRGTRNLKRQKLRFFNLRKAHKKQKKYRIQAHFAKMAKRKRIAREVRVIKATADTTREADREYQLKVLKKWATMKQEYESSL